MSLWVYDPGQTTGFSKFQRISRGKYRLVDWGTFLTWRRLKEQIKRGDIVVYENITVLHPSFNPIGLEIIGVIKFLCNQLDIDPIHQSPSVLYGASKWPINLSFITNTHARDAALHGIAYLGVDNVKLQTQRTL